MPDYDLLAEVPDSKPNPSGKHCCPFRQHVSRSEPSRWRGRKTRLV
jgi:hypothetical protein